jgi:ribonuclease-3
VTAPAAAEGPPDGHLQGQRLAELLHYRFANVSLARMALTHASAVVASGECNERLEFIGDRVLGLIIANVLYQAYPEEAVGDLAARYASLVSAPTLAAVAEKLQLADLIRCAPTRQGGAPINQAVLADACEAIIGAIFLDGGLDAATAFVRRHWDELMEAAAAPPRDAKSRLQEWAQGRGRPLPRYREVERSGPPHAPVFTVEVLLDGEAIGSGAGPSKQRAEQAAAAEALARIEGTANP